MIGNDQISFGDNVRIRSTPETVALGVNACTGQVYGVTTPSSTGVDVVGSSAEDLAINVHFDERSEAFWFAPELVELIDHAQGTTVDIDGAKAIRNADGSWATNSPISSFLSRFLGRFQ